VGPLQADVPADVMIINADPLPQNSSLAVSGHNNHSPHPTGHTSLSTRHTSLSTGPGTDTATRTQGLHCRQAEDNSVRQQQTIPRMCLAHEC
jgi:hypothetical protein